MQHKLFRFHVHAFTWRSLWSEEVSAFVLAVFLLTSPAAAVIRFEPRALYMPNVTPGATTTYTITLQYASPDPVGSVDMLACNDPIPYMPCDVPTGFDWSHATLSDQTGETGFTIDPATHTANHIVLTRDPTAPAATVPSTYTFSNVVNPTDTSQAFSIRLKSLASTDGSGEQINVGSVRGQVTNGIVIETQVPPMLIFCAAQQVADDCSTTNRTYYTDMGELNDTSTLTAQSQMAVGTNASGGFAITANGDPPAAGTNVIDGLTTPTASTKGTNQFGINLVANNEPNVGTDPIGTWVNAVPSVGYSVPNRYMYIPGDVVAYSPNVSLIKKFTVSYILNSSKDLHPGVYTTTITYIASGRF
jgi:hypothetical protein